VLIVLLLQTPEREFLLRVSYLEIYNEEIRDLLSTAGARLKIHEDLEVSHATPVKTKQ
jgi:centromeric protein E